mmetsp:Transcript_6347/g.9345  ORF Transcript_6347/g.9345 Transcript_6347/m.9345 type:complete len:312 (-) Transcript_6347:38-973(-)
MNVVPIIPGLTFEHFFLCGTDCNSGASSISCGSNGSPRSVDVLTRIPRLRAATIKKGAFCFQWDAKSNSAYTDANKRVYYQMYAKGNILKRQSVMGLRQWWGFQCRCTCSNFKRYAQPMALKSGETENYVCEHLHAALLSVIDPEGFVIDSPLVSRNDDDIDTFSELEEKKKCFIPGLTSQHFINEGGKCHYPPVVKRADIDRYDYFHYVWEAIGGYAVNKSYELGVHGTIRASYGERKVLGARKRDDNIHDWDFEAYCSCPAFEERCRPLNLSSTDKIGNWKPKYVCKHLAAALESVIDFDAQAQIFELD